VVIANDNPSKVASLLSPITPFNFKCKTAGDAVSGSSAVIPVKTRIQNAQPKAERINEAIIVGQKMRQKDIFTKFM
jgi:hypothetical protein